MRKPSEIVEYICPNCGQTSLVKKAGLFRRLRCDACAKELSIQRHLEIYRRTRSAELQEPEVKKRSLDADLDARIRERRKTCQHCVYWYKAGQYQFCDFRTWHEHGPARGEKPGDCKDFKNKAEHSLEELKMRRKAFGHRRL